MQSFAIRRWSAWAPGLTSTADWERWSRERQPLLPQSDGSAPELAEIAPLLRRRLNALGRMAAHVTADVQHASAPCPVVYASRYGDAGRATALLAEVAAGGAASPTAFGLSVHNAIGAVISIARKETIETTAIAAGAATAGAGIIEALGLLADGAPAAAVVCYDEPLPAEYSEFMDEAPATYAWAVRIENPAPGDTSFRLQLEATERGEADGQPAPLPYGLALMRFFLSDSAVWTCEADRRLWRWTRHA